MKSIIWDEASQGMQFEYGDIPADLVATAEEWRTNMVEAAAEASEAQDRTGLQGLRRQDHRWHLHQHRRERRCTGLHPRTGPPLRGTRRAVPVRPRCAASEQDWQCY